MPEIKSVVLVSFNLFGKINYCMINFMPSFIGFRSLDFFEFCLNLSCKYTYTKGEFREVSLQKLFFLLNTYLSVYFSK